MLIKAAQGGDEEAFNSLLASYQPLIQSLANRYFLRSEEREDLVQELQIAFYKAVRVFNGERDTAFASYAKTSLQRVVIDKIRANETDKRKIQHETLTFDEAGHQPNDAANTEAPYKSWESDEEKQKLDEKLRDILSDLEWEVLQARLEGLSYSKIGQKLGISVKSVDNALQRVKQKL